MKNKKALLKQSWALKIDIDVVVSPFRLKVKTVSNYFEFLKNCIKIEEKERIILEGLR